MKHYFYALMFMLTVVGVPSPLSTMNLPTTPEKQIVLPSGTAQVWNVLDNAGVDTYIALQCAQDIPRICTETILRQKLYATLDAHNMACRDKKIIGTQFTDRATTVDALVAALIERSTDATQYLSRK